MIAALLLLGGALAGAAEDAEPAEHCDAPAPGQAGACALRRAASYAGAGNALWARRVLLERLVQEPADLEARSWATWLALSDGDALGAEALLRAAAPPPDSPMAARFALLRAALAELRGRGEEARAELLALDGPLLPGDDALRTELRDRLLGDPGDPFSARVQAGAGWASNPVQSAPQDSGGLSAASSPLLSLDAVLRWEPWAAPVARPLAELRGRGLLPLAEAARSAAWLDLGARAGAEVGGGDRRGRLLYGFELLGVNSGDAYSGQAEEADPDGTWPGRRWYAEAHRGELELQLSERVQLFGGAGRRVFRDLPRTRSELDAGAALLLPLAPRWSLTGVLSGRAQDARMPDWDLLGGTALLRLAAPLPWDGLLLARGYLLFDRFDPGTAEGRRDWTWSLQAGPWTRPLAGLRWGLTWTWTQRESSVSSWSYADHRVLLETRWQPAWGHRAPPEAPVPEGWQPLPWGLEGREDAGLDRVQDLLRQEDAARRGSTCAD